MNYSGRRAQSSPGRAFEGGLSVSGSKLRDISDSVVFNASNNRTKQFLDELVTKKQSIAEKLLREKQPHQRKSLRRSGEMSLSVAGGDSMTINDSLTGMSVISPDRSSINSITKQSMLTKSVSAASPSKYSATRTMGASCAVQTIDDQNMSLFSSKSQIYVKKKAPNPFIRTLENNVPVVFPHYDTKKSAKEVHSKAFKDKIAEVMLQSQQYGRIELPYLFSLLKQSGGKSTAYLSGKSSAEIVADAYRKLETARSQEKESTLSISERSEEMEVNCSFDDINTRGEATDREGTGDSLDDIFDYIPKKRQNGLLLKPTNEAAPKNNNNNNANKRLSTVVAKEPPLVAPKPVVMEDHVLEELLTSVDRERLNFHLRRQAAFAKNNPK